MSCKYGLKSGSNIFSFDLTAPVRLIAAMKYLLALLIVITSLWVGCGAGQVSAPEFNGDRSYEYLLRQVDFGPRVPGTDSWRQCRSYFYTYFTELGLTIDSQAFTFVDPYSGRELPLVNVIARYRGGEKDDKPILLMAHWDSRPRADYASTPERALEPIDGANDGASGVAVLMELAHMLVDKPPKVNVDLVLVDGEDWGKSGDFDYYLLGSRHFASVGKGIRGKYRFGIVVDMVGDSDQQIYRDSISQQFHPAINNMIWNVAAELGINTFIDSIGVGLIDDHMSLNAAGVPASVIIDFDYPYWHTEEDTPDKCSAQSLKNVGSVLGYIIYNPSIWPKK